MLRGTVIGFPILPSLRRGRVTPPVRPVVFSFSPLPGTRSRGTATSRSRIAAPGAPAGVGLAVRVSLLPVAFPLSPVRLAFIFPPLLLLQPRDPKHLLEFTPRIKQGGSQLRELLDHLLPSSGVAGRRIPVFNGVGRIWRAHHCTRLGMRRQRLPGRRRLAAEEKGTAANRFILA